MLPLGLHILGDPALGSGLFPSCPHVSDLKLGKNHKAGAIAWELLLLPLSECLNFPDYFIRPLLDKSAEKILSLTFSSASVPATAHLSACTAPHDTTPTAPYPPAGSPQPHTELGMHSLPLEASSWKWSSFFRGVLQATRSCCGNGLDQIYFLCNSSNNLCLQLLNLFALLSAEQQRQPADLSEI